MSTGQILQFLALLLRAQSRLTPGIQAAEDRRRFLNLLARCWLWTLCHQQFSTLRTRSSRLGALVASHIVLTPNFHSHSTTIGPISPSRPSWALKVLQQSCRSASAADMSSSFPSQVQNGAPSPSARKLHGRAFYESIGSPKMIVAPMVDRSEYVGTHASPSSNTSLTAPAGLANPHPLVP